MLQYLCKIQNEYTVENAILMDQNVSSSEAATVDSFTFGDFMRTQVGAELLRAREHSGQPPVPEDAIPQLSNPCKTEQPSAGCKISCPP